MTSSIIAPRIDLPMVDPKTGLVSRQWYVFLSRLVVSIDNSPTSSDDVALRDIMENTSTEALSLQVSNTAATAIANAAAAQSTANAALLLSLWPPDQK